MQFYNTPTKTNEVTLGLRRQCAKRAMTMCLMLEEAKRDGAKDDEHARRAVYRYGLAAGEDMRREIKDHTSMREFAEHFGVGLDRDIFEMETIVSDDDRLYIDFHYCPYVAEWLKMGRDPKEIDFLCDLAMEGDRAIGASFPAFKFTLGKTIAQGNKVCEIRFDRKEQ